MSNCVAAIDCGTNTTRLLIESPTGDVVVRELRNTRLGQGVNASGELAPDAVARSLAALEEFKALMDVHSVTKFRAVATSAARDAKNGADFLAQATAILGRPLEVLTGDEEGRLSYLGATSPAHPGSVSIYPPHENVNAHSAGPTLVIDIGGGSTELVFGRRDRVVAASSLNLGCVRLSEQFFDGGPYMASQIRTAMDFIDAQVATIKPPDGLGGDLDGDVNAVGVGGTVTTLAALDLELATYEPGAVQGFRLGATALAMRFSQLTAAEPDALKRQPGMAPQRSEVIVAGTAILVSIFARFGLEAIWVSEMDILNGLIAGLE